MAGCLGIEVLFPQKGMYMDNAAMVAGLGFQLYNKRIFSDYRMSAEPNLNF